jgi:hypothetical protein
LHFLPPKHIVHAFNEIKSIAHDEFKQILEYFETYYIGEPNSKNSKSRKAPMFSIDLWNVYKRVAEDLPRTNNPVEVWHKVFELSCQKHSTVNKLIEQFRLEQNNTDVIIDQINSGDIFKRKRSELLKDEAVKDILADHKHKTDSMNTLKRLIKVI